MPISNIIVLLLLVCSALAWQVVGQVTGRVDGHVMADGASTAVQALLTPLIIGCHVQ